MSAKDRSRNKDGPRSIPISGAGGQDGPEDALKSASQRAGERAEALLRAAAEGGSQSEPAAEDEQLPPQSELLDKLKRVKADFANYQRRMDSERKTWAENGRREVLSGLLPAVDQLEITVRAAEEHKDYEGLKTAVELVQSEIVKFLKFAGVERMETVGGIFDPEVHEALFSKPTEDAEPGVVIEEVRPGYMLGEYVLRPSQVVVSAAPPAPPAPQAPAGGDEAGAPAAQEVPPATATADEPDEGE